MGRKRFRLGHWTFDPDSNAIYTDDVRQQLEPRAIDVLVFLCERAPAVVSAEEVLDACWGGAPQGDNAVHKTIAQLRRALGDESAAPRYIETIRKRGYRVVAEVRAEDDIVPGSWLDESPFRGLEAFEERHAPIFCGRRHAVDALRQAVLRQVESGCAMALVLGASGAGKTSLVRAGLVPRLQAERGTRLAIDSVMQFDCADAAQTDLFAALASVLLDAEVNGEPVFADESANSLGRKLAADPTRVADRLRAAFGAIRLLVFIDRFEAIFRLPQIDEASRIAFVGGLDALARSGAALVVLACRNDFYPHLAAYPTLMALKEHGAQFDLPPPNGADLRQIIRQPAGAARLHFEVDNTSGLALDEVLCDAAKASADMLPLLQYCLQELYRQRGADGELTHAVYQGIGGIDGAIGARAEQVIATLAPAQVAALPGVLSRLVSVAEDEWAVTARPVPWEALRSADEQELVKALVEARLFVSDLHGGTPAFGIVHEAVLRRWPRVATWIARHRELLQVQTRVRAQAHRWQAAGRPRDLLLPAGVQTRQGQSLLAHEGIVLEASERIYIEASLRRARIGERVRFAAVAMIAGLALLAGIFGLMAKAAQAQAEQHRTEAEGLLGYMLGDFVDKLRPIGKLDLLDSVSAKALEYLSRSDGEALNATSLTQRAKALQLISEVNIERGNTSAATTALLSARGILQRQLAVSADDREVLKNLGANAFWLGRIRMEQGDPDQAAQYFRQYKDYSDRLHALEPDNVEWWIEQAYAHSSLGSLAFKRGDARNAGAEFLLSIDLKTKARVRKPQDHGLAADLANSLSWLGSVKETLGELDAATGLYRRETEMVQSIHQAAPNDALWNNRLALALQHQALVKLALGQDNAALGDFQVAQELLERALRQEPSNRGWQRNYLYAQLDGMRIMARRSTAKSILPQLQDIGHAALSLAQRDPQQMESARLAATAQQRIAVTLLDLHRGQEARQHLAESQRRLQDALERNPSDLPTRSALADGWLILAQAEASANDAAASRHACQQARELIAKDVPHSADYHILAPWVRAHVCLGDDAIVVDAKARLAQIGYREPGYIRFLSTHE
jgi:DNA-binding winged helix-turn-helix (wHTH) protein/tetratricopeptide (TPR) repeat protein